MPPRFSVVIPCYNRANTVLPTLLSVQHQTFADFECVVVDDGSADGDALVRVVDGLKDPRFRVVRRINGGGGAARNTGIEAATGDWIAFLDSDDLFLPEKLAIYHREALASDGLTVLYSQNFVDRGVERRWVRPSRAIRVNEDVGEYLFVANCFIQTSTIAASRDLFNRVKFDPGLPKGQDLDLCVRLAAAGATFRMIEPPQSIWVDRAEAGRTSRHQGYEVLESWLEGAVPILTPRAVRGYRATILAYHMASARPFAAFGMIVDGFLRGGVSFQDTSRQILRSFLPRSLYRRLVDQIVSRRGV